MIEQLLIEIRDVLKDIRGYKEKQEEAERESLQLLRAILKELEGPAPGASLQINFGKPEPQGPKPLKPITKTT